MFLGEEVKVGADEVGCYVNEFGVGGLGFVGFRVFEGKTDGWMRKTVGLRDDIY